MFVFCCVMLYWAIHILSGRVVSRQQKLKGARSLAEFQHGCVALLHSLFAVLSGFLLLYLGPSSGCGPRLFCVNNTASIMMDLHLGFFLYELMFYHNHSKTGVRPQFGMTFLHHTLFIMGYLLTRLYPCRLSLDLLPTYQLCCVPEVFNALRLLLNQWGAAPHVHFNNLLAMLGSGLARVLMAAVAAWKAFTWIRAVELWNLELPDDQSVFNIPYGLLLVAGSALMLLIYIKWFAQATDIVNNLVSAIERQRNLKKEGEGGGDAEVKEGQKQRKKK